MADSNTDAETGLGGTPERHRARNALQVLMNVEQRPYTFVDQLRDRLVLIETDLEDEMPTGDEKLRRVREQAPND